MTRQHPASLWPDPAALGTVTDLYQLTMMAGYQAAGIAHERASFELFVRRLPPHRSYLVFAGLEQALLDLSRLAFSREQAEDLRTLPAFRHIDPAWFDALPDLRFDGDVWAIPEGSVVFPGEPLVRVDARLPIAQWVETYLIAALNYPTLVATKAARIVQSAGGRNCYDFGARRAHGPQAGLLAARASYLAGFAGTSHVEAGRRLGIPVVGTMAHSWVQAFASELEAFQAFARAFPDSTTLLVDTYDTLEGVRLAASVEPPVQAIRIDSGDLLELSRQVRRILDEHGRASTRILASGDLDEWSIRRLVELGAPIDGFGVGTELVTSRDAPALSMVYKLVAVNGQGRFKRSPGKRTYPLAKQVHRLYHAIGLIFRDHVTRHDESVHGEPLLIPHMTRGRLERLPTIEEIRARTRRDLARLPAHLLDLDAAAPTDLVTYSDSLELEADRLGVKL